MNFPDDPNRVNLRAVKNLVIQTAKRLGVLRIVLGIGSADGQTVRNTPRRAGLDLSEQGKLPSRMCTFLTLQRFSRTRCRQTKRRLRTTIAAASFSNFLSAMWKHSPIVHTHTHPYDVCLLLAHCWLSVYEGCLCGGGFVTNRDVHLTIFRSHR